MKNKPGLQKLFVFFVGIAVTVLWFIAGEGIISDGSTMVQICGFVVLLSTSATVFYIFFHQKELDDFAHSQYTAGITEGYKQAYQDQNRIQSIANDLALQNRIDFYKSLGHMEGAYIAEIHIYQELLRQLAVGEAKGGDADSIEAMLYDATEGMYKVGYYNGYNAAKKGEEPEFDLDNYKP